MAGRFRFQGGFTALKTKTLELPGLRPGMAGGAFGEKPGANSVRGRASHSLRSCRGLDRSPRRTTFGGARVALAALVPRAGWKPVADNLPARASHSLRSCPRLAGSPWRTTFGPARRTRCARAAGWLEARAERPSGPRVDLPAL